MAVHAGASRAPAVQAWVIHSLTWTRRSWDKDRHRDRAHRQGRQVRRPELADELQSARNDPWGSARAIETER